MVDEAAPLLGLAETTLDGVEPFLTVVGVEPSGRWKKVVRCEAQGGGAKIKSQLLTDELIAADRGDSLSELDQEARLEMNKCQPRKARIQRGQLRTNSVGAARSDR